MTKKNKKQEMIPAVNEALPPWINPDAVPRGSENVEVEDLAIPRLEIVQALSPIRKKNDPNYNEEAEEGIMYNNITSEFYGESVQVIFVMFNKEFLVWKDRKSGGGFGGSFSNVTEANDQIIKLVNDGDNGPWEVAPTAQHLCLLLHPDGRTDEMVISMSKSKMKVSRKLNSMIRITGGDRFSRIYEVKVIFEHGTKGDFYNFQIKQARFPSKELYLKAEQLYNDIVSGNKSFKVSSSDLSQDENDF